MGIIQAMKKVVGGAEIMTMLGVSRQRVSQLTAHPSFPKPYETLAMGSVWRTEDVIAWAEARGRVITTKDVDQ